MLQIKIIKGISQTSNEITLTGNLVVGNITLSKTVYIWADATKLELQEAKELIVDDLKARAIECIDYAEVVLND